MPIDHDLKANASPTKTFFVRMITRDISLEDCILDLVDNSVDGAWKCEGSRPMGLAEQADLSKYWVKISAYGDRFVIEDNCGGMTLDDAINHAFSFGRRTDDAQDAYSIGVYGIGMKRAVFKLGTSIRIRSTYHREDGQREAFVVPIKVNDWVAQEAPPWDFDIEPDEELGVDGVQIAVDVVTETAATSLGSPAFVQDLRRTIARDYSLHLNQGLKIFVNDDEIRGWQIELRQSDDFAPLRMSYEQEIGAEFVNVEIIGGMAAPPPESSEPSEEDDGDRRFGWYVVCNGRIVLAADKTGVAGWGTEDWPQWHRQYSGFIGFILFTAANASTLPLTTTKRSVDVSSAVFRAARPRMRDVSKSWIAYTNARKQAMEDAKRKEEAAVSVSIYAVPQQRSVKVPLLNIQPPVRIANVNYSVSLARMKKLAKAMGSVTLSYKDVGVQSFDYTYDELVGED